MGQEPEKRDEPAHTITIVGNEIRVDGYPMAYITAHAPKSLREDFINELDGAEF